MLAYTGDLSGVHGVGAALRGRALAEFETLAQRHHLPYSVAGDRLRGRAR